MHEQLGAAATLGVVAAKQSSVFNPRCFEANRVLVEQMTKVQHPDTVHGYFNQKFGTNVVYHLDYLKPGTSLRAGFSVSQIGIMNELRNKRPVALTFRLTETGNEAFDNYNCPDKVFPLLLSKSCPLSHQDSHPFVERTVVVIAALHVEETETPLFGKPIKKTYWSFRAKGYAGYPFALGGVGDFRCHDLDEMYKKGRLQVWGMNSVGGGSSYQM